MIDVIEDVDDGFVSSLDDTLGQVVELAVVGDTLFN